MSNFDPEKEYEGRHQFETKTPYKVLVQFLVRIQEVVPEEYLDRVSIYTAMVGEEGLADWEKPKVIFWKYMPEEEK